MGKADVFTGMSLTEKLIWLKKFGNGGGSGEKYEDRTATGNPVIFTTNFAQNAKALSVDFTPKQNLNGYSKPWAGGAGENLLPFIACDNATRSGITWTKNADGSIHIKGTATASEVMSRTQNVLATDKSYLTYFDPGKYAITSFGGRLWVQFTDEEQSKQTFSGNTVRDGETAYYTFTEKTAVYARISVKSSDGAVDNDVKVSVVKEWTAPTGWTPYENICPITGVDSIDVVANSNTHEFDLGRTVYGGILNAKTGVLTVTDASIASYNGETLPSTWISDRDEYKAGTTPTIGAQVVYKLATPQTYQLTAQEIALLEGENVIATDGDSLNVTYQVKV